ncbi:uncharacterized protein TEOVI_000160600 [Trypanosoma equiperdum]|uniref:Uncharacterized protein n=1 Tax=Trypanosoma equiperdum TaxID=5694 RepID=A0A1G4ICY6_TRYEQ|nr:hypothetical protein, conserved [Trypanosoma equiperdum]
MHIWRTAASNWVKRHARSNAARWRRPEPASSSAAAKTIARLLAVGGHGCWSEATALYAEALATKSVQRYGVVTPAHRHDCIALILGAMSSSVDASGSDINRGEESLTPHYGMLAERLSLDIIVPHSDVGQEEKEAASVACIAVFRALLTSGRTHAVQRFAQQLLRSRNSREHGLWALRTIMLAVTAREEGMYRQLFLHSGLLKDLEHLTGLDAFTVVMSSCDGHEKNIGPCGGRTEGNLGRDEVHRVAARWCVDVALHMHTCPWRFCLTNEKEPRRETAFNSEVTSYCCAKELPMPAFAVTMLPFEVLRSNAVGVLRCCTAAGNGSHGNEVVTFDGTASNVSGGRSGDSTSCSTTAPSLGLPALKRLQDVVSAAIEVPLSTYEPVECLYLLLQISRDSTAPDPRRVMPSTMNILWWRRHLQSCVLESVKSAVRWKSVCDFVGLSRLVTERVPHCFPLLVAHAAESPDALRTLFNEVSRQEGAAAHPVDDIPRSCVMGLLQMCGDERSAAVIDWVVEHCKDHESIAQFVLDSLGQHQKLASVVVRRLFQRSEQSSDVINALSRLLEKGTCRTLLADVCSLVPQAQQWTVALRFVSGMSAPEVGHVHTAFMAFVGNCDEQFAINMALLWSDETFTWLKADVNPPPRRVYMDDRWSDALRLVALGAERLTQRPELLGKYIRYFSKRVAVNSRLYMELEALLACSKVGGGSARNCGRSSNWNPIASTVTGGPPLETSLVGVRTGVLPKGQQWMEACAHASEVGVTRGVLEILAKRGRWEEATILLARAEAKRRVEWAPLVIRAARLSSQWRAALSVAEKIAANGMKLHYSVVAELLACCFSADVPLEVVQLWLHRRSVGESTSSHVLFGLGPGSSLRTEQRDANDKHNVFGDASRWLGSAQAELFFVLLESSSSRSSDHQWRYALQLLKEHVLLSGGVPSARVFRSTYSILHRAERWRESLQLLGLQRSVCGSPTVKCVHLVLSTLPSTAWQYALGALQCIPPGDSGSIHRVLPLLLPVSWESALGLMIDHRVMTNTAMECVVGCEDVPLVLRLQAWRRLLPSLPVSMKHRAAPIYLRLAAGVADGDVGVEGTNGLDAMCVIERSIRGLRGDYINYASFVYHRALLHRHWCNDSLHPSGGVAAFRALSGIAEVDQQCEVSAAALEQLSNIVERLEQVCGTVSASTATHGSQHLERTVPVVNSGEILQGSAPTNARRDPETHCFSFVSSYWLSLFYLFRYCRCVISSSLFPFFLKKKDQGSGLPIFDVMRLHTVRAPIITRAAMRGYSEARSNYDGTSLPAWPAPGKKPTYPAALSELRLPQPRMRKTRTEWMYYHGHGGCPGKYGPSREIADFEYADGTPASISGRRFAFKHHQDHLLVQLIRAAATVERYDASGLLPRIPGTAEQRNWDPAIPLFLDDVDEQGRPAPLRTAGDAPGTMVSHVCSRVVDERMGTPTHTPNELANRHEGETLEANTMFATNDPSAFVSDTVKLRDDKRPYWSRRRWALTDKFLVPKSPKPKNTIKDE